MPRFEYLDKAAVAALRVYVLEKRRKLAAAPLRPQTARCAAAEGAIWLRGKAWGLPAFTHSRPDPRRPDRVSAEVLALEPRAADDHVLRAVSFAVRDRYTWRLGRDSARADAQLLRERFGFEGSAVPQPWRNVRAHRRVDPLLALRIHEIHDLTFRGTLPCSAARVHAFTT
jgi:hypothetical protein